MSGQSRVRPEFAALGWLLSYPSTEIQEDAAALARVVSGCRSISSELKARLHQLAVFLSDTPLLELQEQYTAQFDRGRFVSLYLFEHVHGEARERGQAMVDLSSLFGQHGFEMAGAELPDFLPVLCEFSSLAPVAVSTQLIGDAAPVIEKLAMRLVERRSPYAVLPLALLELCEVAHAVVIEDAVMERGASMERGSVVARGAASERANALEPGTAAAPHLGKAQGQVGSTTSHARDNDFDALDAQWREEPVSFGFGAAHDSCALPSAALSRGGAATAAEAVPLRRSKKGPVLSQSRC